VGTPLFWPLAAKLSYALATTAFAYSGIAHHDALATGYLVLAFCLILQVSRGGATKRAAYLKAAGAGLLLGLTITTSMLPFFMVVLCALYFLFLRRSKLLAVFLVGMLAGLLPLFVYDAVSFGNPFLLPNVAGAGMFADTFFHFDPKNLGDKLVFYASSVAAYVLIFAVGLLGLSYYPRQIKRGPEFITLVALMIALAAFVFNISSDGDCQFGPRYLLPAMPFACLGIAGYSYLSTSSERRLAGVAVVLAGAVSFVVNLVGALRGAMSCPHGQNAFWNHVAAIQMGEGRSYPLALWLLLPLLICTALFVLEIIAERRAESSPG
jgi:4-amino-4-deoxy-L-arabinose transferase-like glycosyltransferase